MSFTTRENDGDVSLQQFLRGCEDSNEQVIKRTRLEWAVEDLGYLVDLPDFKIEEAKQIFRSFEKSILDDYYGGRGRDYIVEPAIAGALLHFASRISPVMPRWKKLLVSNARNFSLQSVGRDGLDNVRYSRTYWQDALTKSMNFLKEKNRPVGNFELQPLKPSDYTPYIVDLFDVGEPVECFVLRNLSRLRMDSGFSVESKSPVALNAALVRHGLKACDRRVQSFEKMAETVCLDSRSVKRNFELLKDEELV